MITNGSACAISRASSIFAARRMVSPSPAGCPGALVSGPEAKAADFQIIGEVKVKQLSAKLAASGLTITKTALTSWTVKAIDKGTGEEIYTNTKMPKNTSWATEDAALADIGKLVGDEFSKNFFLAHFSFGQAYDRKARETVREMHFDRHRRRFHARQRAAVQHCKRHDLPCMHMSER